MMEKYEKLIDTSPNGSTKPQVFVCTTSNQPPPPVTDCDSPASMPFGDTADSNQRYVEAVNGIANFTFRAGNTKVSSMSASSNGEVGGELREFFDGRLRPPWCGDVLLPNDGATMVYLLVSLPMMGRGQRWPATTSRTWIRTGRPGLCTPIPRLWGSSELFIEITCSGSRHLNWRRQCGWRCR